MELHTEAITILLPLSKISEQQNLLGEWPEGWRTATVRELQLSKQHLNGQEGTEAGGEVHGVLGVVEMVPD